MRVDQKVRHLRRLWTSSRKGYTLTEVMLVLGIIATVAAISWPALMKPWARSEVQTAAHELASQLLATRMRAIEESRVYEFRWQPGTGEFEIRAPHQGRQLPERNPQAHLLQNRPFDEREANSLDVVGNIAAPASESRTIPTGAKRATHIRERLTNDVAFESEKLRLQMTPEEFRPEGVLEQLQEAEQQAAEKTERDADRADPTQPLQSLHWRGNIWFYPDGSSTNGRWDLLSIDQHEVTVKLRGLTGTVHVGNVRPMTFELPDETADLDSTDDAGSRRPMTEQTSTPPINNVRSYQ